MPLLPRTLLLLDEPFVEAGGQYYSRSTFWRFAAKLAAHCPALTLYVPLATNVRNPTGAAVDATGFRIVGRPYYERIKSYYARLPLDWRRLRRQARELVAEHDLVIIRVGGPASKFLVHEASRQGKPLAMLIVGDIRRCSAWVANQRGPTAWIGRILTRWVRRQEYAWAHRCAFVGAWGEELREMFRAYCPRIEVCQDPIIEARHLTFRADTCQRQPIRLVRVGGLIPTKGIEFLLDASAQLIAAGRAIALDIVGAADDARYADSLHERARRLGIDRCVAFHGPIPFGEELFKLYRAADIHVISSLSEGLPRVIAEGRAFCLPTVATAVGGIPSVVHDGEDGLLVPPADAPALAAAIARLIDDGDLRRRIIANSFERAKYSTAEYHAERLARLIAGAAGFVSEA